MYVKRKDLQLSDDEIAAYLRAHIWGRLGTVSADGEPHVSPIGFIYLDGHAFFHSLVKSRRGRHIGDEARVALCVDDGVAEGDTYSQRRGVVVYGVCRQMADDDDRLPALRDAFGVRFFGAGDARYERRTHAWYDIEPYRFASWDFGRIPAGSDRFAATELGEK